VFRKRVPGVGSGDRKSSAADGSPSDWRHDQTVSSGRTYMLGLGLGLWLGLVLGLFSAPLGPARTRSPMFDRLQRRNNSHGLLYSLHPAVSRLASAQIYSSHAILRRRRRRKTRAAALRPCLFPTCNVCVPVDLFTVLTHTGDSDAILFHVHAS